MSPPASTGQGVSFLLSGTAEQVRQWLATPRKQQAKGGTTTRETSKSTPDEKAFEEVANLSEQLGGLILTEKESTIFIFEDQGSDRPRASRWSAMGKMWSPRPINLNAFARAM